MPEDDNTKALFILDVAAITVSQATFVASIASHLLLPDNEDENSTEMSEDTVGLQSGVNLTSIVTPMLAIVD